MSREADAFEALKARVEQTVQQFVAMAAWDEMPGVVERPANEPRAIPEQSLVIIRNLGLSTPVAEFGRGANRAIKECTVRAQIEIYTRDQNEMDRDEALDGLKTYIGEALEIDPSLGGVIEDSNIEEADLDSFGEEGHDTIAGAAISATLIWYSERALG